MPLDPSKSREAFRKNIAAEVKAGKPLKQALAIAYAERRKMADGGVVDFGGKASYEPLRGAKHAPAAVPEYIPLTSSMKVNEGTYPGVETAPNGHLPWLQYDESGHLVRDPSGAAMIRNPAHPATARLAAEISANLAKARARWAAPSPTVADGLAKGGVAGKDGEPVKFESAEAYQRRQGADPHVAPSDAVADDPAGNFLIETASGPIAGGVKGVAVAGKRAVDAFRDSRGLAALYHAAADEVPKLAGLGGKVANFAIEKGADVGATQAAAHKLGEAAEPPMARRVLEAWRAFKNPAHVVAQAPEAATARTIGRRVVVGTSDEAPLSAAARESGTAVTPGKVPAPAKVSYAAGEAPHPAGYTPKDVVDKQKDLLNQFFASRGVAKYAHGGRVFNPSHRDIYENAAAAVQHFAHGGDVEPGAVSVEDAHVARPVDHYAPRIVGVDMHPVSIEPRVTVGEPVLDGATLPQSETPVSAPAEPAKTAGYSSMGGIQVGKDAVPKAEELSPLDKIEADRRAALEDTRPSFGRRLARGLANGAIAFGKGTPVDFDAEDRKARDEANAEADKRRANYIGAPGEMEERGAHTADSPLSARLRSVVGKLAGDPHATEGLSASQVMTLMGPIREGNADAVAKQLAALRGAMLQQKASMDLANLQEKHRANDIRAAAVGQTGKNAEDTRFQRFGQAAMSTRGAPDYAKALEARRIIDEMDNIVKQQGGKNFNQVHYKALAAALARLESGGAATEGVVKDFAPETFKGRLAQAEQYLSGRPTPGGYDKIINEMYVPFLKEMRKAQDRAIQLHADRQAAAGKALGFAPEKLAGLHEAIMKGQGASLPPDAGEPDGKDPASADLFQDEE